jgi:hypothetical protein
MPAASRWRPDRSGEQTYQRRGDETNTADRVAKNVDRLWLRNSWRLHQAFDDEDYAPRSRLTKQDSQPRNASKPAPPPAYLPFLHPCNQYVANIER